MNRPTSFIRHFIDKFNHYDTIHDWNLRLKPSDRIAIDTENKHFIFFTWAKETVDLFNQSDQHSEQMLREALDWFLNLVESHSINDQLDLLSRIFIFSSIRKIQSLTSPALDNSTNLIQSLTKISGQFAFTDLLLVVAIDPFKWVMDNHTKYAGTSTKSLIESLLSSEFVQPSYADHRFICIYTLPLGCDARYALVQFTSTLVDLFMDAFLKSDFPLVSVLEIKLAWILNIFLDGFNACSSLSAILTARLGQLLSLIQTLDSNVLGDLCTQLFTLLESKSATARQGPPTPAYPDLVSSFVAKFDPASQGIANQRTESKTPVIISLEGIWVQCDHDVDRLCMYTQVAVQEHALDETQISYAPGVLDMSYSRITWNGVERDTNAASAIMEPALSLEYRHILRYTHGRVVDATNLPFASHTLHTIAPPVESNDAHYVSLYTRDQVYRMYPIYTAELGRVVHVLHCATDKPPFSPSQFVKYTLAKRMFHTQHRILDAFLRPNNKCHWIDHSEQLVAVLKKLTQEREAQSLADIERLFHSCRLEAEVTKETVFYLQAFWHSSQSEIVRMKILAIVDRLLHPSIFRNLDPNFLAVFKWLNYLENTVSPYKSPESLKVILVLMQRAKAIQVDPLSPLTTQVQASFDQLNDFNTFRSFF